MSFISSFCRQSIIAIVLLGFLQPAFSQQPSDTCQPLAELVRTNGIVKVQLHGAAMPLSKLALPHPLCKGDQVFTLKNATAKLEYNAGELVLTEQSKVLIDNKTTIKLEQGSALFEVTKRDKKQAFQAHTPLVVIGVKGTQFLLSSTEQTTQVALVRGLIDVARQDQQKIAHFSAKPLSDMSFAEYQQQQQSQLQSYSQQLHQNFAEYKAQMELEFSAYKSSIELAAGQQLTLNSDSNKPEALEAPLSEAANNLQRQLARWLN